MKRSLKIITIITLVSCLSVGVFADKKSEPQDDKINWMPLDKGLVALEADSSGKHVFIDVTASWCGWCKKMEKDTFSDPDIIKFMNDNFIAVKLWGDSENILDIQGYQISEKSLANGEFKVRGYPGFYFITPDKKKFPVQGGYKKKDVLMFMLKQVESRAYEADIQKSNDAVPKNK